MICYVLLILTFYNLWTIAVYSSKNKIFLKSHTLENLSCNHKNHMKFRELWGSVHTHWTMHFLCPVLFKMLCTIYWHNTHCYLIFSLVSVISHVKQINTVLYNHSTNPELITSLYDKLWTPWHSGAAIDANTRSSHLEKAFLKKMSNATWSYNIFSF